MPNNFLHTGLILLALPNARVIDVRRHRSAAASPYSSNISLADRVSAIAFRR